MSLTAKVQLEILKVLYSARSRSETNDAAKEALAEQSKTAHDLCSVIALNGAFEECQERDNYDVGECHRLLLQWLGKLIPTNRGHLATSWPLPLANRSPGEAIEAVRVCRRI